MGEIVGGIIALVSGLVLASGVTFTVVETSAPDRGINFEDVQTPDPWASAVDYGQP